jgi:hypothetical protein
MPELKEGDYFEAELEFINQPGLVPSRFAKVKIHKKDAIAIAQRFNIIDNAILHGKRTAGMLATYENEFITELLNET